MGWQKVLSEGFHSSSDLLRFLGLPASDSVAEYSFKVRVPRNFAALMKPGDPKDPLLLQVLATDEEQRIYAAYEDDPLQEAAANPIPGLLHKYHGRVLVTLTSACAVHCRYCFRRHFPYRENNPGRLGWQKIFDYIARNPSIHEVILSGGDPLSVSDLYLSQFISTLETISHVKILRFHTRVPVVLPERIDASFLNMLKNITLKTVMVMHCNHPNEVGDAFKAACFRLRDENISLLNQSVLLKGVNDSANILEKLSLRLFSCGILPYYLHLLDRVNGAGHFEVDFERAKQIYHVLQSKIAGYLVPRLVREISGKAGKTLVGLV